MISRLQEALDDRIQALGNIPGEYYLAWVRTVEEFREQHSGLEDDLLGLIGSFVGPAIDIAAGACHEFIDGIGNRCRLRECGAGIVKIDGLLHGESFLKKLMIHAQFITAWADEANTYIRCGKTSWFRL